MEYSSSPSLLVAPREAGARQAGEAGLHAYGVLGVLRELVGGHQVDGGIGAGTGDGDVGVSQGHRVTELLVAHGLLDHQGHIARGAVQVALEAVVVKAVGVLVNGIGASQRRRLLVHGVDESLFGVGRAGRTGIDHGLPHRLGDGHCRVVAGGHEQRRKGRLKGHSVAVEQSRRRLAHRGRFGGNLHGRIERHDAVVNRLERHQPRHDLRDRGDLGRRIGVALVVDGPVGAHADSVLRLDAGALGDGEAAGVYRRPRDDVVLAHLGVRRR